MKQSKAVVSTASYLLISLFLTLHNKMVLQWYNFGFPWLVTAVHSLGGIIGMQILLVTGYFTPKELDKKQMKILLMFSLLYTMNIAMSNVSLHYVSVPLHQIVRGTVPVFTVIITLAWGLAPQGYSWRVYSSLAPVVFGVGLTTYNDYYSFSLIGFILTFVGTILAAAKTVVTNTILVGGYKLKLPAFDLLYRLTPLTFVQTITWSVMSGETSEAWAFVQGLRTQREGGSSNSDKPGGIYSLVAALMVNGAIAFVLNIASFTASKNTSALAMTVTGNVKVALTVILGCAFFHVTLTSLSIVGILFTIVGGAVYSAVRLSETQKAREQASKELV
ncbi:hypothetical protein COEREDRAFT_79774 [Coemansia reversa NRRL 1564]|uniref:Sugar phosphate transporter domain-containing protein n=1 Tax=Coemansia reversa (strain ATCC 12441 / NRRL 1564) TaxID=763665 RepID=A0A2G5BGZ6_COERN|nr:hypothetical protein COEREDRAFT_79774 [Coemansia reversa NRRL 1564]|eukprot:PIA18261.1 hypothetical protein COEREDRAFT_79774 [Coemansia reversa NRRL 1564]